MIKQGEKTESFLASVPRLEGGRMQIFEKIVTQVNLREKNHNKLIWKSEKSKKSYLNEKHEERCKKHIFLWQWYNWGQNTEHLQAASPVRVSYWWRRLEMPCVLSPDVIDSYWWRRLEVSCVLSPAVIYDELGLTSTSFDQWPHPRP